MGYFEAERMSGLSQFITLPLPPSVNSYWRKSPRGMYITEQGMKFRKQVAEIIAEKQCLKFGESRLFMAVRLCMRSKKKADLDNRLKALCDALEHAGVFDDDEQIDELLVLRGPIVKGGECYVMISEKADSLFEAR
jgi:crossover junction endodeoxyribonuclease RusA